jgi:hypothetical protein
MKSLSSNQETTACGEGGGNRKVLHRVPNRQPWNAEGNPHKMTERKHVALLQSDRKQGK